MLTVISPAKKLNPQPLPLGLKSTSPEYLDEARILGTVTRKLSRAHIKQMMQLSDPLAELTYERFAALDFDNAGLGNPAVLTFAGDVYRGLDARSLSADDMGFAQTHLRILSGLYGLLRPLDLIQPYRLEMGRKLHTARGEDLYDFWGGRISNALSRQLERTKSPVLLNLASNEYFKSVDKTALGTTIISPVFKEIKDGQARTLAVFAKPARGLMARWIIQKRIDEPEALKDFTLGDYAYDAAGSTPARPLFTRPQPMKKAA